MALTTDEPQTNQRIAQRLGLRMPILTDADGSVLRQLDMWDARWQVAAKGYTIVDPRRRVVAHFRGSWRPSDEAVDFFLARIAEIPAG